MAGMSSELVLLGFSYVRVIAVWNLFWNLTEFDLLLPF